MQKQRIFVIIPVHNRVHYTEACLCSLERQTVQGFNIVVVDDGSSDGTKQTLAAQFPYVTVLIGDGNLWWSRAMNKGLKYALDRGAEYIVSLNNDLEVAEDYIEKMLYWAKEKPEAILGSYAFDIKTGEPHDASSRIDWRKRAIPLLGVVPPAEREGLYWVTHLPGRGMWIPAVVFRRIGLFDARRFPQYAADYDFTLTARREGFEVFTNFDARLYSHVEAWAGRQYREELSLRNYIRHLTNIKGTGNLRCFVLYTLKNCPSRYKFQYLIKGIILRLGGYPLRYLEQKVKRVVLLRRQ